MSYFGSWRCDVAMSEQTEKQELTPDSSVPRFYDCSSSFEGSTVFDEWSLAQMWLLSSLFVVEISGTCWLEKDPFCNEFMCFWCQMEDRYLGGAHYSIHSESQNLLPSQSPLIVQ